MRFQGRRVSVDWGHLVVLALIAGATVWYILDARSVSTELNNLLLIQPLAIVALLLCLFILPQCFRLAGPAEAEGRADAPLAPSVPPAAKEVATSDIMQPKLPTERIEILKMLGMGALLGTYVFSLRTIGFDVATFLFALIGMLICGERRPLPLVVFPVVVTLVTVLGFKAMMPYPMPTTVL